MQNKHEKRTFEHKKKQKIDVRMEASGVFLKFLNNSLGDFFRNNNAFCLLLSLFFLKIIIYESCANINYSHNNELIITAVW